MRSKCSKFEFRVLLKSIDKMVKKKPMVFLTGSLLKSSSISNRSCISSGSGSDVVLVAFGCLVTARLSPPASPLFFLHNTSPFPSSTDNHQNDLRENLPWIESLELFHNELSQVHMRYQSNFYQGPSSPSRILKMMQTSAKFLQQMYGDIII